MYWATTLEQVAGQVVKTAKDQLGCRFLSFDDDGERRLHEWLTTHVMATATVRISEQEAAEIVRGPSLI